MIGEERHSGSARTTDLFEVRRSFERLQPVVPRDASVADVEVVHVSRDRAEPVAPEHLDEVLVSGGYGSCRSWAK